MSQSRRRSSTRTAARSRRPSTSSAGTRATEGTPDSADDASDAKQESSGAAEKAKDVTSGAAGGASAAKQESSGAAEKAKDVTSGAAGDADSAKPATTRRSARRKSPAAEQATEDAVAATAASEAETSDSDAAGSPKGSAEPADNDGERVPTGRRPDRTAPPRGRKGSKRGKRTSPRGRKRSEGGVPSRGGTWTGEMQLPDGGLAIADSDGKLIQLVPARLAASLRLLVARLGRDSDGGLPKRVAFTSALSGEGVSVLARSFAAVLAVDAGHRVCLVDLNWWTFHRRTYRRSEELHGAYEVLWMDKPIDEVLVETQIPQLSYLPAGSAPQAVRPTLAQHPRLGDVLDDLSSRFDHIVLDLPAVMATSDAITLSQFSDQVVMVVRQGVASRAQIRSAVDDLGVARPVAGLLNASRSDIPRSIRKLLGL